MRQKIFPQKYKCLLLVNLHLVSNKELASYVTYTETKGNALNLSQKKYLTMVLVKIFVFLRGCLYGGELVQLGGLAHLGEISPSLRNSNENMLI